MKTKIKRHSRSVIAVVLTLCMLVSCMTVGLIATDAAKVTDSSKVGATFSDDESVGYSSDTVYVGGSWDSWAKPDGNIGHILNGSNNFTYSVELQAGDTYYFSFFGDNGDRFRKDQTFSSSISSYNFTKAANADAKLKATVTGIYRFKFNGYDGGQSSMLVDVTFPADQTTHTWTVVGGITTDGGESDPIFGTTWDPTLTQNDMTESSGTSYTWTKNNVTLNDDSTIYYKVAKDHAWDTAVPAGDNKTTVTLGGNTVDTNTSKVPAGSYNITVTFNGSNDVNMTLTSAAKSTLTVQADISDARVTATYNGTTVGEGQSIQEVPQGATVSVTVKPVSGKQCTAVTGTYNTNSTVDGTGAGQSWSLVMPGANTTVSVTLGDVTMKKIYFNNNYTQYGTVYAYVYDLDGSGNPTYEYLGAKPGKVMTESANSEIWYIDVPNDVDYVEFISGDGKTTGEMAIPWLTSNESQKYDNPKYTPPYNYDAPTIANGGTWGNYIWGDKLGDDRDNVYTVTNGQSMDENTHPNLFTGITATMYDYYTDIELNGAWLTGLNTDASYYNVSKWDPYTKLNSALSAYADADKKSDGTTAWPNAKQPKYGVTYPLYFGNLDKTDVTDELVSGYYNFVHKVNNSNGLGTGHGNDALTGLSGNRLGDDKTIHYYKSGATNENGAPMAMFNEDFLSGENIHNKPLATILRTSSFPVRKETIYTKIYFDISSTTWWTESNARVWAHLWDDNGNTNDVYLSGNFDNNIATIPSAGYTHVVFLRVKDGTSTEYIEWGENDANVWNKTDNLTIPPDGNVRFKTSGDNNGATSGEWKTQSNVPNHTYYEFDSEGGKDNAYITNINTTNKTANIDYSTTEKVRANSTNNPYGFFPFDNNNLGGNHTGDSNTAHDLGFGMKLTIPFTLEGTGTENGINTDGTDQEFRFSGDDDLWVFVDDKLVLDLGGAHGRTEGTINFHTKTVNATNQQSVASGISRNGDFSQGFNTNENYVHTMTIYYMERGMFDSNLRFGFSFHAVPNQFWIDKKIRTKDKDNLGYDTINAGFFNKNNQNGAADNMTTYTVGGKTTTMSKFEKSFQNEKFWVTHWYGDPTANLLAENKDYTIDNDTTTYTVGSDGKYPIYHDLGNAFIRQFTTGQQFKLIEEPDGSNKYVYQPVFSVWDQANNDKKIQPNGNNTNGYTFTFNPTTSVSGGIENTNIKARFENYMVAHNLTLTKELTNTTDPESTFTFQILFDFSTSGTANYVSFPLYCYVDGVRTKLSDTGTIAVKAGQVVVIDEIPEKAKIQVTEVLTDTVSGYRYAGMTLKKGSTVLTKDTNYTEITKGIQFQMGDGDMSAVISNKNPDNKYTITYTYPSYGASPKNPNTLYGDQSYTVTGVFTKSELDNYMMLSNGKLVFKDENAEKTFINNKAPYEDNFMQNLSFANATLTKTGTGWDTNGDYTCEATTTSTADYSINAYFNLPYEVDDNLIPKESGTTGKVAYSDTKRAYGVKEMTCFDWYVTAGPSNKKTSGTPIFVKAPLILYPDPTTDTAKYFQYWSVKSQSAYGKRSTEYTRCYDYEFNFALFMDSIIEPIYADTWAQPAATGPKNYKDYGRYNPEIQIQGNDIGINIAFLENSRNQYNDGGNGSRNVDPEAADVIYSDFLLNFNYNKTYGLVQLNQLGADKKKAGLVIEAVGRMDYEVDENNEPTKNFDFDKNYSEVESFYANETDQKNAIKAWLQGGTKPARCVNSQFDVTALDNKNCKQYYYSLNNRKPSDGQLLNTSQNRYQVFRAYAYIGDVVANQNGLANVKLSDPVYFTIYDVGSQRLPDNVITNQGG